MLYYQNNKVWNSGTRGIVVIGDARHPAVRLDNGAVAVLHRGCWYDQNSLYKLGVESSRFMVPQSMLQAA